MDEEFMGVIKAFGGSFAPKGWLVCQGQTLNINQYQALYAVIGITYGGDGKTTFCLPDLRSRVPVGPNKGLPFTYAELGTKGGAETASLSQDHMPAHSHVVPQRPVIGTALFRIGEATAKEAEAEGKAFAQASAPLTNNKRPNVFSNKLSFTENNTLHQDSVDVSHLTSSEVSCNAAGGSYPFSIMQPFLTLNYIICVSGIFPSPN